MGKRPLSGVLALAIAAAAGFVVAWMLKPTPASGPIADVADAAAPARTGYADRREPVVPRGRTEQPSTTSDTLLDILELDSDFAQTAALYRLLDTAGVAELERLIAEADSVPGASDRRAALSIIYGRYADLDPAAALDFIRRQGGSFLDVELRAVFHAWARMDLEAAVEAAAELPPQMRQVAGTVILTSRDDLAGDARRDIARRLNVESVLPRLAMQQSMDAVDRDPLSAWQQALAAGDGMHGHQQLSGIARGWARTDPLAALDAAALLSNPTLRARLQGEVLGVWGEQAPREALEWALAQPPSPQRHQLTMRTLAALAAVEPRAAFDIARGLEGQELEQGMGQVLAQWARQDAGAAARSVDSLTESRVRTRAISSVTSAYLQQDPEGALQWIGRLNPQETVNATAMAFSVLGRQDPVRAAELAARLPDARSRATAAAMVAQGWAGHDPRAAARWVDTLPGEERRSATAQLVRQWSQFDRQAALQYAEALPTAAERDRALVSVIQSSHQDLDLAEDLFERLTEPAQRQRAARRLFFLLRESDPQRAAYYREQAGIDARADGRPDTVIFRD